MIVDSAGWPAELVNKIICEVWAELPVLHNIWSTELAYRFDKAARLRPYK